MYMFVMYSVTIFKVNEVANNTTGASKMSHNNFKSKALNYLTTSDMLFRLIPTGATELKTVT